MLKEIENNGEKRAEKFQKMPAFIKNFLAKRSFVMAEFLIKDKDKTFLSGMSTLMLKLGPGLIGKGTKRFWDRLAFSVLLILREVQQAIALTRSF